MSQAADSQSSSSTDDENSTSGIVITNAPQTEPTPDNLEEAPSDPEDEAEGAPSDDIVDEDNGEADVEPQASDSPDAAEEASQDAVEEGVDAGDEQADVEEDSTEDTAEAAVSESEEVATESATAAGSESDIEVESDDLEADESQTAPAAADEESADGSEEADSTTEETTMTETQTEPEAEQNGQSDDFTGVEADVNSPPSEFDAIVEASTLKDAIDGVGVLVDECKIRTSEEGIQIRAVDPANVGMVDLTLAAPAFESLNTENGILGISWERFESVVGLANSGDLVHLDYDYQTRKLNVEVDGLSYTLALIDPDSIRAEPDIPNLDLPAEVTVKGSQIGRGVKAADMVSDHIRLQADDVDREFRFSAEGDTDDVNLKLESDDLIAFGALAPADSLFSLDYMKDMNKAIPKDAEVTMELGEEFPIKLHFGFADGHGQTTYMLAPRIQSD